ncbi:MAG TPA: DNA repair protein RadC [Kofleriaceae bacterium]|nr:DNA repair protein RadC [Kofleriaceae bacterium]
MTDLFDDRPRERLWRDGVGATGDLELVAILLGTGVRARPAIAVATALVESVGGLAAISRASPRELAQVAGVGAARAARIAAAFELGRRAIARIDRRDPLVEPEDVYRNLAPRLAGLQQEVFLSIGLDIRNGMLDIVEVGRGSVAAVDVHPREVFRPLVRMAAAGAVVVHNHPTGDPTPSQEDVALTRRLRAAGDVLGIPLVDHVIIGGTEFVSVAEWLGGD